MSLEKQKNKYVSYDLESLTNDDLKNLILQLKRKIGRMNRPFILKPLDFEGTKDDYVYWLQSERYKMQLEIRSRYRKEYKKQHRKWWWWF